MYMYLTYVVHKHFTQNIQRRITQTSASLKCCILHRSWSRFRILHTPTELDLYGVNSKLYSGENPPKSPPPSFFLSVKLQYNVFLQNDFK